MKTDDTGNLTSLYWIAALVAIIFIGYICYRCLAQKGKGKMEKLSFQHSSSHEMTQSVSVSDKIKKEEIPSFSPIIKFFKGQCNAFKIVAQKPRSLENCEKIFEYADNVIEFHADDKLKMWWNGFASERKQWDLMQYKEKATLMLSVFRKSGVIASTELIITWNENASKHYMPFDDIETGDICNVIQPCWIYQNEIFEQGLVSKKLTN